MRSAAAPGATRRQHLRAQQLPLVEAQLAGEREAFERMAMLMDQMEVPAQTLEFLGNASPFAQHDGQYASSLPDAAVA